MKVFLTSIILALLSSPVLAETVYFCSTDQRAIMDKSNISTQPDRFKMLVDSKQVKLIGGRSFTTGVALEIEAFWHENMFTSKSVVHAGDHRYFTFAIAFFADRTLAYTNIGSGEAITIIASCDKF